MVKITSIVRYFIQNYPHPEELSKARITKMVYLADWYSVKSNNKQLTKINWFYDHYGPFVTDVFLEVSKDQNFEIVNSVNRYGNPKQIITLKKNNFSLLIFSKVDEVTRKILDEVIADTKNLYWTEFIKYVYSTPPIAEGTKYSELVLTNYIDQK